jgi:hypothetical protein
MTTWDVRRANHNQGQMTYRRTPSTEVVSAVAHHEAGHAVAMVLAFRHAAWLPHPPPPLLVRYVEITEHAPGQWTGSCVGPNIYSVRWPIDCIAEPYRDLMERQIVIELAGGVAEAIHRGERRESEVLAFAEAHCCIDADLEQARAVLGDLFRLTGRRHDAQAFVGSTLALLMTHLPAVEALASALIAHRRIEGKRVEQIIDHA